MGLCKEARPVPPKREGKQQEAILFRKAQCFRNQTEPFYEIISFHEIIAFCLLQLAPYLTQPSQNLRKRSPLNRRNAFLFNPAM
jgi:hypothetical protein